MKYYVFVLFSILLNIGFSQNCDNILLGEINDFHDKTPIVGATIFIKNLNKYVTTDIEGKFKIKNLCNGQINLVITHIACEAKTVNYTISGDTFKSITLEHHIEELNEVNVKGRLKTETTTAQETVLKSKILSKYSNQSLGDALKEVPGVTSLNTGNAIVKPIINGMHSSRILILNNNVRLQDQEWGVEHAPSIDINAAGQISVIKGSGSLAYGGDAIGGVIVIKPTRPILKDTLYGRTSIIGQTNGKGITINSNLNKSFKKGWFTNFQGSYKRIGDLKAPDYYLTNTGIKSSAFSVNFGRKTFESGFNLFYSYLNNEIGILRSAHIGNIKNLATALNSPRPLFTEDLGYDITEPKQDVTHHLVKAAYFKRFKNFGKLNLQYDYQNNQRFEFDIRRGGRSSKPAIDLLLQTHTISANTLIDNNASFTLNFGVLGRYQNNFANPETGVRRLIPDYDKNDFGVFSTSEWDINDNLTIDAGLRYDFSNINAKKFYRTSTWFDNGYDEDFNDIIIGSVVGSQIFEDEILPNASQFYTNPNFNYHNISAGAGFKYTINDNHQISFGYSLASRAPNPSELFSDGLHHSAARIERGDLRIQSEKSNRLYASYLFQKSRIQIQLETFFNKINDYIYLVPGAEGIIPLIRGPFPVFEYIQTNATLFGADLSIDYTFSDFWKLHHQSTFIKGYDTKANLPLIDIPPFTTTNSITYTNKKWSNFTTSIESEWSFRQNEFPTEFNYSVAIANEDDIFVDLSPPAAYHLLHLQCGINTSVFKKSNLDIRLRVNNIFNTNYRNSLNRLRFFADEAGRNISLQLQLNY